MNLEPRHEDDYSKRQIEAAHRALVDVGQVLASFQDCMVLVGGWVPELLIHNPEEKHVGSIDVDFALDAVKLASGRYAEMLKLLLDTRRYKQGEQPFQLVTKVDLRDGEPPVQVEIEFLAPKEAKLKRNKPKLLPGFRVLQADGCAAAFHDPQQVQILGKMVKGARNKVQISVASLPDFLIMKALALAGRDKPKDAYDICFCFDNYPGGMARLAKEWTSRKRNKNVAKAVAILREKFESVGAYGPMQIVEFHNSTSPDERDTQARRAYELVQAFLNKL